MPKRDRETHLTRREEQILNILYRRGEASISDLQRYLPNSPTSGAIRRLLNLLHRKGAIDHRQEGAKKIYRAVVEKSEAGSRALQQVVDTFFGGSPVNTMGALFSNPKVKLSDEERRTLSKLIRNAKSEGR